MTPEIAQRPDPAPLAPGRDDVESHAAPQDRRAHDDALAVDNRAVLLDLAVESTHLGLWSVDLDGDDPGRLPDRCQMSDGMKLLGGYAPDELPSSPCAWLEVCLPEDRDRVLDTMMAHLTGRSSDHELEYRIRHRDGSIRWLRSCGRVLHDDRGHPQRWVGIELDVTEQRRREEEALRSQQKFASLFRLIPCPAALATAPEGRFVEVNEALARALKYSREELVGRTSIELGIWPSEEERNRFMTELAERGSVLDLRVTLVNAEGAHRDVEATAGPPPHKIDHSSGNGAGRQGALDSRVHDTSVVQRERRVVAGVAGSLSVGYNNRQTRRALMARADQVPDFLRVLAEKLSQPRPMRRGSLGERFIKCGKARCACATDEQARHGPYFSLTHLQQ
jgi:PAS domain S-box-containing protein